MGTLSAADPQQVAEAVRSAMFLQDNAAQSLAMQVTRIAPGEATVTMAVRKDMLNGFHICHGGMVTTLADTAFAYACNSFNELTLASGLSIDLLAASHEGDVLTARASQVWQAGRSGVYDVEVRNQRDERIALFRGRSHRLQGKSVVALDGQS
jgi:acyl-CoA thioesterase